jgi:hypothetical protein
MLHTLLPRCCPIIDPSWTLNDIYFADLNDIVDSNNNNNIDSNSNDYYSDNYESDNTNE